LSRATDRRLRLAGLDPASAFSFNGFGEQTGPGSRPG
jgi:hypothetical protein